MPLNLSMVVSIHWGNIGLYGGYRDNGKENGNCYFGLRL